MRPLTEQQEAEEAKAEADRIKAIRISAMREIGSKGGKAGKGKRKSPGGGRKPTCLCGSCPKCQMREYQRNRRHP